jgi:BlaI family transcriptional regulator, penicillinase repressor
MSRNRTDIPALSLSRRERQILDALFRAGEATAADIQAQLPQPPSYSAVRALLRILEDKGHILHRQEGSRYVYAPVMQREQAKKSALRHLLDTFFEGSAAVAVAALLDGEAGSLTAEELERLEQRIADARLEAE